MGLVDIFQRVGDDVDQMNLPATHARKPGCMVGGFLTVLGEVDRKEDRGEVSHATHRSALTAALFVLQANAARGSEAALRRGERFGTVGSQPSE